METCKLCVSIPGKSLKIDMPRPDAEVWFTTLVDALLNTPEPDQEPGEDTEEESEYEDGEREEIDLRFIDLKTGEKPE